MRPNSSQISIELKRPNTGGYIALISVLILSALFIIIATGTSVRGIDAARVIFAKEQSSIAEALAGACAEEAIMRLKSSLGYSGNELIIVHGGDVCRIGELEGSGNIDRRINTSATVGEFTRHLRVDLAQVGPNVVIRSWGLFAE